MLVLITYDVNMQTVARHKRLRQVTGFCTNYGQHVQNFVFECVLDAVHCTQVKHVPLEVVDADSDSLRFYYQGNHYKSTVEHFGVKPGIDVEETLFV